jgi:PPE-repeat protein
MISVLPPQIHSIRIFAGAGSAPMSEAAAWEAQAGELASAATSFSSVTSGLAGASRQGAASQAMTAAASPYGKWLSAVTEPVEQAATRARTECEAMWPADVTGVVGSHAGLLHRC